MEIFDEILAILIEESLDDTQDFVEKFVETYLE